MVKMGLRAGRFGSNIDSVLRRDESRKRIVLHCALTGLLHFAWRSPFSSTVAYLLMERLAHPDRWLLCVDWQTHPTNAELIMQKRKKVRRT
jgi:hypothetical protein